MIINHKIRRSLLSIYFVFTLIIAGFICILAFEGVLDEGGVEAADTWYVGTGQTYTKIQDAIDNASSGDTIRVFCGKYSENLIVNKTLTLIGNGSVKADGGDVQLIDVKDGVVTLKLTGAGGGCPMAAMTLKGGIERVIKEQVPEVKEIVAV